MAVNMAVHSPDDEVVPATPLAPPIPIRREHAGADRGVRILVVHPHDLVRSGFRLLLGPLPWVGRCLGASTAEEALAHWNRYEPHLAIIDLMVSDGRGTDLCARLRNLRPQGRVMLLSSSERMSSRAVLAAGASGLILAGAPAQRIIEAVRLASEGRSVPNCNAPTGGLSGRKHEILTLMAAGATNREIASRLRLSPHTVKGHTSELYKRLHVRNRAQAVRRAERMGLLG